MTKPYNTRWPDADKQRARAMFITGASYTTIGAYFHVSRCSVAGLARRAGWRDSDRAPGQRWATTREIIDEICVRFMAGESAREISLSLGKSRTYAQGVLSKCNVRATDRPAK